LVLNVVSWYATRQTQLAYQNFKLPALTFAEISRGSHNFWDASLAQPPANFGFKVVLASNHVGLPKWYKNTFVASVVTATVCFKQKTNFVMQNLGDLGTNGGRGSKFLVENVIFGIADADLPIYYATFMGLR